MGREIIQARGGVFELAIQKEERKETVERLKQPLKYMFGWGKLYHQERTCSLPGTKKEN